MSPLKRARASTSSMPSTDVDFERLDASALNFQAVVINSTPAIVIKGVLLSKPQRLNDVSIKSGLRAGTQVPKVEFQMMDSSGEISRVVLLFEEAEKHIANMTVGSTYYITQLTAKRVSESIVPSGVELSSWSAMTTIFPAPQTYELKSSSSAKGLTLQQIAEVPIGSIVCVRGMVTYTSEVDESLRLRKVILT